MEIYSQNEFLSKTDEQCLKDIFLKENSVNATRKLQWGKNRLKPNLVVLFDYIDFFDKYLGL